MNERYLTTRQADDEFEHMDEEELADYLSELAPNIGWVIIYFNSLEDGLSRCIREAILRDPIQDERMDVFLAEMQFAAKCRALMHLYGQAIESTAVKVTHDDLLKLEAVLLECAKRRNEYAHADWVGLRAGGQARVKSQSKRRGIVHRYKKFDIAKVEEDVDYIACARDTLDDFDYRLTEQLWGRA